MRGRRQRASSPMPPSLLPCLAVRKGLCPQPLTVRRPFLIARSQQHLQERVAILPEIHPPREIGVHGALVPSHVSIKCRPLSARSGCWAGHTCCPLTGHAVAYDHDHHLFGYVPGLLGPHLSYIFTLPTHCSLTARSHVRLIRPHFHIGLRPRRCRRRGVPDLCGRTSSAQRSARPCGRSPPPQASGTGAWRAAVLSNRYLRDR